MTFITTLGIFGKILTFSHPKCDCNVIYYSRDEDNPLLLNLINTSRKSDKRSASLAFHHFSPTCKINIIKHELSCKIISNSIVVMVALQMQKEQKSQTSTCTFHFNQLYSSRHFFFFQECVVEKSCSYFSAKHMLWVQMYSEFSG